MAQNTFNLNRLSKFLIRQGTLNIQPLVLAIGGIFGILILISFTTAYFRPQVIDNLIPLYLTVFFFAGFIFTSKVFDELNSPLRSYAFHTLPVSSFEKALGSWLLSSPIYVLVYGSIISAIFISCSLIAGRPLEFMLLFRIEILFTIGVFMITQTVFFLGACTFRNYNFLKTLLSLFLIALGLALFAGLLVVVFFGGDFNGDHISGEDIGGDFQELGTVVFTQIIPFIFWYIIGPFLLLVSYFKVKEREV